MKTINYNKGIIMKYEEFINDMIKEMELITAEDSNPFNPISIEDWIVNNKTEFINFMELLYDLSLCTEERRPITLKISLTTDAIIPTVEFNNPLDLDIQTLKKLSPAVNLWKQLIIQPIDNKLKITGLLLNQNERLFYWKTTDFIQKFQIEINGPANFKIGRPYDKVFNKKIISKTQRLIKIPELENLFIKHSVNIKNIYISNPKASKRRGDYLAIDSAEIVLLNLINFIKNSKHGGCILIVPENSKIHNLTETKFKVNCNSLLSSMCFVAQNQKHDSLLENMESCVASFSQTDGAIILDDNFQIKEFGSRIVAPKCKKNPMEGKGTRHKSAADFCSKIKGSIAIIISEDENITILVSQNKGIKTYKDIQLIDNNKG